MRSHRRRFSDLSLVTTLFSCMSISSTHLTKFSRKRRILMRNSGFLPKKSTTKVRKNFSRSDGGKRRKDDVICQDSGEKRQTHIVADMDSTTKSAASGDTPADLKGVHKGPQIPQGLSLGGKTESGERPHKRPRDIDAAEPSLVHKSPPAKKAKKNERRQNNIKSRPKEQAAVKGDVSFKNLKSLDIRMTSGEAPKVSQKRKAPTSEDSQPGTSPPAKRAAVETITDSSTNILGCPVLETPKVETPDTLRHQNAKKLSPEHLSILKSTGQAGMLDDDIINMAQEILHNQFEDFDGLQPAAVLLFPGYSVLQKAVQIHYDENRVHWLTTSFKNGDILVADSINTNHLSPSIQEQIKNIYSDVVHEPLKHLRFLNVDQQRNGYDCGVFAIAFAFELLAADGDPTATFEHEKMRDHLISCLQNGRITGFPRTDPQQSCSLF